MRATPGVRAMLLHMGQHYDENMSEEIWPVLIDEIKTRPWLGHGVEVTASDFIASDLSAHNLYLQVTLQTGFLGFITFLGFLLGFMDFVVAWTQTLRCDAIRELFRRIIGAPNIRSFLDAKRSSCGTYRMANSFNRLKFLLKVKCSCRGKWTQ